LFTLTGTRHRRALAGGIYNQDSYKLKKSTIFDTLFITYSCGHGMQIRLSGLVLEIFALT